MPDMTNPELLKTPLAKNGDKNTLPLTTGATTGLFSQDLGFQEINSTPLTAGGKAPDRKDMNAAFNLLGGVAFMAQKGWTFHYDSSQDYYLGCVVIDPADGNRYECIADMTAGTVAPHEDTDGDYWRRYTLGDGEAVGVIKAFAGNGDLPSGYLECDGSAVSRTMYPDLFAAIGTTYGAGDGSTTFNLPNLADNKFAEGSTVAGTVKQAGLPNIEGTLVPTITVNNTVEATGISGTGAFYNNNLARNRKIFTTTSGSGNLNTTVVLDASRSSAVYGNSDTVQPNSLTTRFIIKAFDGQTADSALIDITQYAQELAGKANITGSNLVHHRDVITTSGTYTAPVTGLYKITVKGGGAGGQGGAYNGSVTPAYNFGGAGGGEGGTTISYEIMTAGQTASVVIGAGGAGGNGVTGAYGQAGASGGNTSVTINGNTYTGGGGTMTAGGTGTIPGSTGSTFIETGTKSLAQGGAGGGNGGTKWSGNATFGGGGRGGDANGASNITAGGAGGDGFVWFEYYTPGA